MRYSAPKGSDIWLKDGAVLAAAAVLARLLSALDRVAGVTPLGSTETAPGIMLGRIWREGE